MGSALYRKKLFTFKSKIMSRDLLEPPLNRMSANRCYRVNLVHEVFDLTAALQRNGRVEGSDKTYIEPDSHTSASEEDEETDCNIEELANGNFKLAVHVPSSLYGGIIGFKGSTKRRIETETQTDINVPRHRVVGLANSNENITIKGKSREKVLAARRQLNILMVSLRSRMKATHFLCIPFKSTDVQANYKIFKEKVLSLELPGIVEDLFQDDCRIHITLGVCTLLDESERQHAVQLLKESRELLHCSAFDIHVCGLEIMNDDPGSVRVLYACVQGPELQIFANNCMAPFEKAGISFDKHRRENIKLHITLLNKRFANDDNIASNSFDAREILKRFGDYEFGKVKCNEILLCVLGEKRGKGNFYTVTGSLKF